MENNDTNIDYQKFVRVEDQKWEILEITIGIIFFTWDLYSLFFIQGVPIPTQNPNLTLVSPI